MTKEEAIEAVEVMIANLPPTEIQGEYEFHISKELAEHLNKDKSEIGDVFYYDGIKCRITGLYGITCENYKTMINLTDKEVESLIKNLDENKTMLADLVRQLDEKDLALSQAEDLIYNQNNEIIDKALQIKELKEEAIDLLHHWIHGDNMRNESIRFVREHGDKTIFK